MNWTSMDQFFSMGGYGLYVWGSYAFAALVMLVEPLLAMHRHRRARRDAAEATDAEPHDSFKE
ncbi:MAG: heme exporter protein CcmD [Burkholderiales bacterium]|nr:MAG: heme exporter protein CcmD [Burkholderiales bacterium]